MKRKRMIKITVICALLINSINIYAYAQDRELAGGEILQDLMEKQTIEVEDAITNSDIEQNDIIMGKLNEIYSNVEKEMLPAASGITVLELNETENENQYVDYYGGSYISNNKLNVCVTDMAYSSELRQNISCNNDLNIQEVKYSMNELINFQTNLENQYLKLYEIYSDTDSEEFNLLSSVTGIGMDVIKNSIYVDIMDLTREKENTFFTLFGTYDYLILNHVESPYEEQSSFKPGRALYVKIQDDNGNLKVYRVSMGYRAYWKPKDKAVYGFTSCAHVVRNSIDKKIYMGTKCEKVLGTIRTKKYSGSVDASFIEIANGHTVSMTVKYSDSKLNSVNPDVIGANAYMVSVSTGTTVYKVGSTTGKTGAMVTSTNHTVTYDGTVTLNNMTRTNARSESGDSGGIVYTMYNSRYLPAGTVSGSDSMGMIYSKAVRAAETIHVYPY